MSTQENKEAKEAPTKSSSWTNDDLIDLIRAVKFSNKDLSMRAVHTEITTVMAKNESFEFLSDIKLNDVKKVWKKALSGATKPSEKTDAAANDADILPKTKGILKFYTVGDGSVKSLANDYTMAAAAEIAAGAAENEKEKEDDLNNYVHCFLDVPADKSGTKPHQALINFNDNKSGGKKAGGKSKNKVKGAGAAVDSTNEGGREIVKIQMAAPMPGMEDEKSVMLLYNADRNARTFIHPDSGDDGGYGKIQSLIANQGKCGVLDGGGLKAYFYARITRRIADQDIISIDITSGLAPSQSW
mmetsp:Transcript_21028/g.31126  ORF Transcript_21028/g.31126 Transcript_21028/m.31126 type:complete len:300 (-) Transcript_21028:290-1189(-)